MKMKEEDDDGDENWIYNLFLINIFYISILYKNLLIRVPRSNSIHFYILVHFCFNKQSISFY